MKKIRGWKRRVRQLEEWKHDNNKFDIEFLKDNKFDYKKIFNDPLINDLPVWYKKKIVSAFIDIFNGWKQQADSQLSSYYLKLIISEVDPFDSQLIVAIDEEIEAYKNKFLKYATSVEVPVWLDDSFFKWETYCEYSIWLVEEIETLSDEEKKILMNRLIKIEKVKTYSGDIEEEYIIEDGIIWSTDYESIS